MTHPAVLETERYVATLHAGDHTGHDMAHLERVRRLAIHLAEGEAVDGLVLTLAALLHDVEDEKLGREAGLVARHLDTLALDPDRREHVLTIIGETSFSKQTDPSTRESAILQDADRLDAIGAIGIARTFQFAGSRGSSLYGEHDPTSAVAHFDAKLFRLANQMHTERARQIARERHAFMVTFLDRFEAEWTGQDI
ncbi:HD domain-containing protein [Exiguobacterium aurantiacum]|uniref:Metal-dependent phosphohydrolase n=1 Tax=Exiguobacterium aurantiacum TaxID=33987 RepID=A0ABY5FRD7_9BACL|nr:HD domain-containing protein [Exiguobacterium aurantiacum]UTT44180.1 metal-dependent phosphohydrolase [Exiguobacterium aurantiacum]